MYRTAATHSTVRALAHQPKLSWTSSCWPLKMVLFPRSRTGATRCLHWQRHIHRLKRLADRRLQRCKREGLHRKNNGIRWRFDALKGEGILVEYSYGPVRLETTPRTGMSPVPCSLLSGRTGQGRWKCLHHHGKHYLSKEAMAEAARRRSEIRERVAVKLRHAVIRNNSAAA